jgi:membrane-bound serine protease (ClpP class)
MNDDGNSGSLIAAVILGVAAFGIFFLEFVIPSGGMLAVLCTLCAIASVTLGFMYDPTAGMVLLALYSVAAPFMLVYGLRMATRTPMGRRMVLSATDPARTGAGIAAAAAELPAIGATGEAITPLRPAGFIRLDGRRIDATAEGDLIDAGTQVEVVSTRDGQVRVRRRSA